MQTNNPLPDPTLVSPASSPTRVSSPTLLIAGAAILLAVILVAVFLATRPPDLGPGPTEETLRSDLIGQDLDHAPERGSVMFTRTKIKPEMITALQVVDRVRDTKAGTEQVTIHLELESATASFFGLGGGTPVTLRGNIIMPYKHYDQGWRFEGLSQSGTWQFEEIEH